MPREQNDQYYCELAVSREENGLENGITSRDNIFSCKINSLIEEKDKKPVKFSASDIAKFQGSKFSKQEFEIAL
ncbi:hypothetical protein PGT21_022638 [Puccinia graminis f. sp. tritici]|uniref:Uncharacterized protein n=1 Tax=Puccinia graminis f. sp. tritici TaxID=56615 RepID=A0A5B0QGK2_PUCGR|nr:hypothetical protein PGT21_022638 [Puccinia graminis f. sp. tritici]